MNLEELKVYLKNLLPNSYIYISHSFQGPKGVVIYNIYYNSHLKGVRISISSLLNQTVYRLTTLSGNTPSTPKFSRPLLIDEYTRPIRPNSIINIIDLSGIYLSEY